MARRAGGMRENGRRLRRRRPGQAGRHRPPHRPAPGLRRRQLRRRPRDAAMGHRRRRRHARRHRPPHRRRARMGLRPRQPHRPPRKALDLAPPRAGSSSTWPRTGKPSGRPSECHPAASQSPRLRFCAERMPQWSGAIFTSAISTRVIPAASSGVSPAERAEYVVVAAVAPAADRRRPFLQLLLVAAVVAVDLDDEHLVDRQFPALRQGPGRRRRRAAGDGSALPATGFTLAVVRVAVAVELRLGRLRQGDAREATTCEPATAGEAATITETASALMLNFMTDFLSNGARSRAWRQGPKAHTAGSLKTRTQRKEHSTSGSWKIRPNLRLPPNEWLSAKSLYADSYSRAEARYFTCQGRLSG